MTKITQQTTSVQLLGKEKCVGTNERCVGNQDYKRKIRLFNMVCCWILSSITESWANSFSNGLFWWLNSYSACHITVMSTVQIWPGTLVTCHTPSLSLSLCFLCVFYVFNPFIVGNHDIAAAWLVSLRSISGCSTCYRAWQGVICIQFFQGNETLNAQRTNCPTGTDTAFWTLPVSTVVLVCYFKAASQSLILSLSVSSLSLP